MSLRSLQNTLKPAFKANFKELEVVSGAKDSKIESGVKITITSNGLVCELIYSNYPPLKTKSDNYHEAFTKLLETSDKLTIASAISLKLTR